MNENLREKNYILTFQSCSKLRKKITTYLYLMRIISIQNNFPFTPAVLDNNCNILIKYAFTVF